MSQTVNPLPAGAPPPMYPFNGPSSVSANSGMDSNMPPHKRDLNRPPVLAGPTVASGFSSSTSSLPTQGLSPTHGTEQRRQLTPSQQPTAFAPHGAEVDRPSSSNSARQPLSNTPISFSGGDGQRPRSATSLPFFSVGDVHNFVNHRGKLDQEVQTDEPSPPRFQALRWVWRHRSLALAVGILLAAMAYKLQEQSDAIARLTATKEALKRSRDGLDLRHAERVAAVKEEARAEYEQLLQDHARIAALELENCRLQRQREEEQARAEAQARRERIMKYRCAPPSMA